MKKLALAIATLIATSASFAQSYYVEGAIGSAHINEDCSGIPSCSNNSTGYKLIGGYGLAILLARVVMPVLVRRTSEETVLFVSLALTAATCVLFPFVADPLMLAAISFVFGLGLGCCGPLSMIITYNRAPEGRAGEAMGWRQTFNKFIEVVMPLLFGTLGTAFGLGPAFWLNAAFLGSGAALMKADASARRRSSV